MADYLLSIDQGTSSSRAILFNVSGQILYTAQREFPQYFPSDGWVEHEPEEIWRSVVVVVNEALTKIGADDCIVGVGITNQRETTVVWDRNTGKPIHRAIVWQDRRTSDFCQSLKAKGYENTVQKKTGLLIDPYFSGTKVKWILDSVEGARDKAEKGELAFGTIDTFLLWKLTEGRSHKTDATNASRTMLFNIHDQCWDTELLDVLQIPAKMLPEVCDSADDFGVCGSAMFGTELPILAMIGDQQSALVGQACFKTGMSKSTYGTGCFMMLNTGGQALLSENRLLTTVAYRVNGQTCYAIEGSIFVAGAAVQWLRDGLKLFASAAESEYLASQVALDHGVYLVPAFTGLGAPYWDPDARGGIFGLTRDSGINEIVSATLQSVCYQTRDLQEAMAADGQRPINLRVDGGMVANNWVMQFLAEILGATVERPKVIETTALGAAYLAGLQAGVYESLDEIGELWESDRVFEPVLPSDGRDALYYGWLRAVDRVKSNPI
jgi:glycerol kinase